MKNILKYGLAAGAGTIVLYLLFFWVHPRGLFHPALYWGSTILVLIFVLLAQRAERQQSERYPFRTGLRTGFGVFALATLLFTGFYFVLLNYIDPGLIDLQRSVMQERLGDLAGETPGGIPKEYTGGDLAFTPARALFSLAQNLIGGFVLAAGAAFAMKQA
jgi:hypothetical protein